MPQFHKTKGNSIQRLPLRLGDLFWAQDKSSIVIVNPEATGYYLETRFPLDLPIDIAEFIHFHCKCKFCGSAIAKDLSRCACGDPKEKWKHLVVEYSTELHNAVFNKILDREKGRIKKVRRQLRLDVNGGSHTTDDITSLYEIQEGLCYFCGRSLSIKGKQNCAHIDHYKSIFDGGTNDISNIVLTCASCNHLKGTMHGDDFERLARKSRPPEVGRRLGKIRRKLNIFRSKQAEKSP